MLAADQILVLGKALTPPPGYHVDALVATSYSLELEMALALPLAMLREGDLAGEPLETVPRLDLFEALQRLAPCYRVFCDAGAVYPPSKRWLRILPLLDEVIVPIAMPPLASGRRPSFHPKLILARYVCKGATTKTRAVCMSRNLTGDPALDISVRLDGESVPASQPAAPSDPLAASLRKLLEWTVRPADATRSQALIESLAETTQHTHWQPPNQFASCKFMPLGFGDKAGADNDTAMLHPDEERLLVMSPFLSAPRLRRLTAHGNQHVLVSEPTALECVGTRALEGFAHIHRLTPRIGTGSQLHAKLYLAEGRRHTRWLVGSANATEAAIAGNAEFLIELTSTRKNARIDALLGTTDGIGELLAEYEIAPDDPADPQPEMRSLAEQELRQLAALAFHGTVHDDSDGYAIELTVQPQPLTWSAPRCEITARLAGTENQTSLDLTSAPVGRLTGLQRRELSPFLVLTVELGEDKISRTVALTLEGIDCKTLAQEAIRATVRDPLAYLTYLLTGIETGTELALTFDDEEPDALALAAEQDRPSPNGRPSPALLEKLLQLLEGAQTVNDGRFDDIGFVIHQFAQQLPAELPQLWATLNEARRT
jgi:hypothetical protein